MKFVTFTLCLLESMCSVHLVFYMSMLEPTMFSTFSERTQLAVVLAPVITDGKSKYKISQIVNFKINCCQTCKLFYKVIWLRTKNESKWIPTSKLTHTTNLVSDFHIVYSTKPSPLSLS